jgi:hypothetical protein
VPRGGACEHFTGPKAHREAVRIIEHDGVFDAQTACAGDRGACAHRSPKRRSVHGRHSREWPTLVAVVGNARVRRHEAELHETLEAEGFRVGE